MKKLFTWMLIVSALFMGTVCYIGYLSLEKMQWYHLYLLAGAQLLFLPALMWWKRFFYDLFEIN